MYSRIKYIQNTSLKRALTFKLIKKSNVKKVPTPKFMRFYKLSLKNKLAKNIFEFQEKILVKRVEEYIQENWTLINN